VSAAEARLGRAGRQADPPASESISRAGLRDVALGLQRYFRPGTAKSPLHGLGERCLVDRRGMPRLLITRSPEDAKLILSDRHHTLSLGQALHRLTPHPVLFGDDSLIFLEGEDHAREKRRLSPPFHGQMMRAYERTLGEIAARRIQSWPVNRPVQFVHLAQQFVLDVMRHVIFGVSDQDRQRRLERAMLRYCQVAEGDTFLALGVLGVTFTGRWRGYPPLERAAAAVDAIVLEEIEARRRRHERRSDDCLTLLLDANADEPAPKDDATLARDMRGLMLAGYETTAISLGWVVEMLVHHPNILNTLLEQLDAGDDAYLDAVIAEVLRLRPVFPFTGRKAVAEFELGPIRVPSGTFLIISIMALHERPDLYPDPLTFDPDRFSHTRPGTYTWLPFGGGVHRCLGAAFALFESRVLMRTLLTHRVLLAADPRPEMPRRAHPLLVPSRQAWVILQPNR
jgi:cytochrome P450 family 135